MAELVKNVHLVTVDDIDRVTWVLEKKYAKLYCGKQLYDHVTVCHELKTELIRLLNA